MRRHDRAHHILCCGLPRPFIGWRGLLLILGLALAWQALRGMPWGEAGRHLTGNGPGGLLILLGLNMAMLSLLTVRWWQRIGVFVEFWLMAALLGQSLSFLQGLSVVMAARLAFLTPLPAGLGVLESTLPWVTAALDLGSVLGLSLCLLIRVRDILFSLAGLGLTMKYLTCPGRASTLAKNAG